MNERLEELTDKALTGAISPEEDQELHGLLAASAEDYRRYFQLLAVEIELRNLDEDFDVSDAVMRQVALESQAQTANDPVVIADPPRVEFTPATSEESKNGSVLVWLTRLALAGGFAALAIAAHWWFQSRAEVAATWMAHGAESFEVSRGGRKIAAGPELELMSGDRIRMTGNDASEIRYRDGSSVLLQAGADLIFQPAQADDQVAARRVELRSGVLLASVPDGPRATPMLIRTADAVAVTRGARFQLRLLGKATRVDVFEGAVDLSRRADQEAVTVSAGTFVSTGSKKLNVERIRSFEDLVAYYTLEEGGGKVLRDRSGYGEPVDLFAGGKYPDSVEWAGGGGARFTKSAIWLSKLPAKKIVAACREAKAITVEAWITPDEARQSGPARIVTVSESSSQVNFQLGHGGGSGRGRDSFVMRLRTTKSNNSGYPVLETRAGVARARLTHLVFTHAPDGQRRFFVDGRLVDKGRLDGDFANWVNGFKLALSNDAGGENRFWQGTIHLVAIYARALGEEEVDWHFASGPRQFAPSRDAAR